MLKISKSLKSIKSKLLIAALFSTVLIQTPALAETPQEKGLKIAIATDKADQGWNSNTVSLTMTMENAAGRSSTRQLRLKNLEVIAKGLGDKSLSIFDYPRDVKGTAFLSHTKVLKADDQWLFLPALGRVKRISSANKSGPFMGSEFAYEDILSPEVDKYTYTYLRDETCGDYECYVLERIPTYANSGYTKQLVWIDNAEHRYIKIEFYDRKESLLKTLNYTGYNSYGDNFWRADSFHMDNHQTGKKTTLSYKDYNFNTDLKSEDFTATRLKRAR